MSSTIHAAHYESHSQAEFFFMGSSFKLFQEELCAKLSLDPQGPFEVKYTDSDGDMVSMSTDEELKDALTTPYLEVYVTKAIPLPKNHIKKEAEKGKGLSLLSAEAQEAAMFVMSHAAPSPAPATPLFSPPALKEEPKMETPAPAPAPAPAVSVTPAPAPLPSSSISSAPDASFASKRLAIRAALFEIFLGLFAQPLSSEADEALVQDAQILHQQLASLTIAHNASPSALLDAIHDKLSQAGLPASPSFSALLEKAFSPASQEQEVFGYSETEHTVFINPPAPQEKQQEAITSPPPAAAAAAAAPHAPEDDFIMVSDSQDELIKPAELPSEPAASVPSDLPPIFSSPPPSSSAPSDALLASREVVNEFDPFFPQQPQLSSNNSLPPPSTPAADPPFQILSDDDAPSSSSPPTSAPSDAPLASSHSEMRHSTSSSSLEPHPTVFQQPASVRYAKELEALKSMGFTDEEKLLGVLSNFEGNIETAVAFLFSDSGN